ncbi:MAG TPA: mechanosensitive ion channel family protein [Silvibacterium sp.]|nr:mechanosensitive ion channel family protein [Silvibacterium sp.]
MLFHTSRKWQNYERKIARAALKRTAAWFVAGVGIALFTVTALWAQNNAPAPLDPLGRTSPQDAIMQFLEACHARQYAKAAHYLDLRQLPKADRDKGGSDLARQLEDLLDDTPFDIATLSRSAEGDTGRGLPATRQHLLTMEVGGQTLQLQLERAEVSRGLKVWLVSADSVALIPKAHQILNETSIEKKLPQVLVMHEVLNTPLWRWIALLASGLLIWTASRFIARALAALIGRIAILKTVHADAVLGPLRLILTTTIFRIVLAMVPPSAIVRLYIERAVALGFFLAVAWAGAVVTDIVAERWRNRLDPRIRAMTYSVLPLGQQIFKMFLYLIAVLALLSAWGYNTTTLLAGLGVGGLAIALAAQKTIENLFGGISVIGDRPVLVGDFCRFGNRVGTVTHIGLRSTRIRTLDRTIVSVPNGQFSSMELENFSARDKIWFHQTLRLRRNTTLDQLRQVLSEVQDILQHHTKVEVGSIPVRFTGIGEYSLDIEVFAYVLTSDFDAFLGIQQELLLDIMHAVEDAGTSLAVPLFEGLHVGHMPVGSR